MKFEDCKIGLKVVDKDFDFWGVGVIEKVLKTRVKIRFPDDMGYDLTTYDAPHVRFLKVVETK